MSYTDTVAADRRLLILRALLAAADYTASAMLLRAFLESLGRAVSGDLLAGEIAWLEEQSLVARREEGGQAIVSLAPRGADVARGLARVPGVRRPEPGER